MENKMFNFETKKLISIMKKKGNKDKVYEEFINTLKSISEFDINSYDNSTKRFYISEAPHLLNIALKYKNNKIYHYLMENYKNDINFFNVHSIRALKIEAAKHLSIDDFLFFNQKEKEYIEKNTILSQKVTPLMNTINKFLSEKDFYLSRNSTQLLIKNALLNDNPDIFLHLYKEYNLGIQFNNYNPDNPNVRNWILNKEIVKTISPNVYNNIGTTIDKKDADFFNNINQIVIETNMNRINYEFYRKMVCKNEYNVKNAEIINRLELIIKSPALNRGDRKESYFRDCILYHFKDVDSKEFTDKEIEKIFNLTKDMFPNQISLSYFLRTKDDEGAGYEKNGMPAFYNKQNQRLYHKISEYLEQTEEEKIKNVASFIRVIFDSKSNGQIPEHDILVKNIPVLCMIAESHNIKNIFDHVSDLEKENAFNNLIQSILFDKEYTKQIKEYNIFNFIDNKEYEKLHKQMQKREFEFFDYGQIKHKDDFSRNQPFKNLLKLSAFYNAYSEDVENTILSNDKDKTAILRELVLIKHLGNRLQRQPNTILDHVNKKIDVFYEKTQNKDQCLSKEDIDDIILKLKDFPEIGSEKLSRPDKYFSAYFEKIILDKQISNELTMTNAVNKKRL